MAKTKIEGTVRNGKLFLTNMPLYNDKIQGLEGKKFFIEFIEIEEDVSFGLHKYYRGVLLKGAQNCLEFEGWTRDEIHKYFASEHLKRITSIKAGKSLSKKILKNFDSVLRTWTDDGECLNVEYIISTGSLSNNEMKEYINLVERELITKHRLKI